MHLPPYKAAVDAGVGSVMSSFNEIDGVPATGNKWLLTDLLRKQWGFKGVVVYDYTSVSEMINHGVGDLQTALGTQLVQGIGQGLAGDGKTVGGGCLVAGSGGGLDRHHGVAGQADGQREDAAGRGECWKVHGSPVRNRNDLHKQKP